MLDKVKKNLFYPCCGMDWVSPIKLLGKENYNFFFCDIREYKSWKTVSENVKFFKMDAWDVISSLDKIDVLFYRRDSMGEGGSGIKILGEDYLTRLSVKFSSFGVELYTDGSNVSKSRFKALKNNRVYFENYHIKISKNQEFKSENLIAFDLNYTSF